MNKIKTALLLFIFFLGLNGLVYMMSESYKNDRISLELQQKLSTLKTHYKLLLHNQIMLADAAYASIVTNPEFIEIYSQLNDASPMQRDMLRQKLHALLKPHYNTLAMQGVLQHQFVLPNTESVLRLHKPSRYGDSLLNIREDFTYTNATKLPIRGLTQGRVSHGFRNSYPIFAPDSTYLGAMEVSFPSNDIQNNLTNISNIESHFLIKKSIFDAKSWPLDDLIINYKQSSLHEDYMLSINEKDIQRYKYINLDNKEKFNSLKEQVKIGISNSKEFALYIQQDDKSASVISFLPIYNVFNTDVLAWLVSYEDSKIVAQSIATSVHIRILFFVIFSILMLLLYRLILSNYITAKEHKLINDILSATDDIIFITDFEKVRFCNKKFKEFFAISNIKEFEQLYKKCIDIFLDHDEYLHKALLEDDQDFAKLIKSTQTKNRVVLMRDNFLTYNSFAISIANISYEQESSYLVTLTDITKLKEHEQAILKQAYTDELTGIANRAKLNELFDIELSRALRHNSKLSMTIIDIDHFKKFNDTYGHLIGDEVLVMLTNIIDNNIRDYDIFARWGGEEFVILFPETSKDDAALICDKLRALIEKVPHKSAGFITVSFGVAELDEAEDDIESLFKRCDKALYKAKNSGRNRVEVL